MKQPKLMIAVAVLTWLAAAPTSFAQEHGFKYSDQASWGDDCQTGKTQSPVLLNLQIRSIAPDGEVDEESIHFVRRKAECTFTYGSYPLKSWHTGHAIQLDAPEDSSYGFRFAADPGEAAPLYRLLQVHFHVPAEHVLMTMRASAPQKFALEAHLVHSEPGSRSPKAVLAILFKEGAPNSFLASLLAKPLPRPPTTSASPSATRGDTTDRTDTADLKQLLPRIATVVRYDGSLTTPPCSEGIVWHVADGDMTASEEQIRRLRERVGFENNRKIVPRPVWGIEAWVKMGGQ